MGWNYGGAVIDFDYTAANGGDVQKAGVQVLEELGQSVIAADAPIHFDDASSRDFDGFAFVTIGGKALVLSRAVGFNQESMVDEGNAISAKRGEVVFFLFNDASGSYMYSVYRHGARVRFFSAGPGLSDDEGEPHPAEAGHEHPYDRIHAVVAHTLGVKFFSDETMERFDANR